MHFLSKVSHSSVESLVDRSSNGVVAGNDARFMSKHQDRNARYHEIISAPLVDAGNVVLCTSGDEIVVIRQHA